MKVMTKANGVALAAAAATMFLAAPVAVSAAGSAMGYCMGANACKGQSACKTIDHSCRSHHACKGRNACKGQGYKIESKAACAEDSAKDHAQYKYLTSGMLHSS